ncbi:MAG: glycosyltransferase family 39 protein [Saprospiraceae bacterium]|nr:glycosyltransferase family 39 protein [Saprospiraceae bacterium]
MRVFIGNIFFEAPQNDGLLYNANALEIINKPNWIINPSEQNARAPVYPFFLSIIYLIFGVNNFTAVIFFQAILGVLSCVFIFYISKHLFNEKVAFLSLTISTLYLPYLRYTGSILRETMIFFFVVASIYSLLIYIKNPKSFKDLTVASLFYTLLIHTDPRYLFFLPLLIFAYWPFQISRVLIKKYFYYTLLIIVMSLPWLIRNYIAYDGLVVISSVYLDFRSNHSRHAQSFMEDSINLSSTENSVHSAKIITNEERLLIKKGLNPRNRSLAEIEAVLEDIYPPSNYLERRLFMLGEFFRVTKFEGNFFPYPSGKFDVWSNKHNLANIFSYGIVLIFTVLALMYLVIKRKWQYLYFIIPIIIQAILHTFVWSRERYRHPIEFLFIIYASFGIYIIYRMLLSRIKKKPFDIKYTPFYVSSKIIS